MSIEFNSMAESDRIYGSWDISYSEHALDIDDPRTSLFLAITLDNYDQVIDAVKGGACPDSVFMPVGSKIELPDSRIFFANPRSDERVKKYGISSVGLCILLLRSNALRGLIDCGAVIEDAYLVGMQAKETAGESPRLCAAIDNSITMQLVKIKKGWHLLSGLDSVIYNGELRQEIMQQTWVPRIRGVNSNATSDKSGCFIATACYGSADAPAVRVLRQYRDSSLLPNPVGRIFVQFYYVFSPPISKFLLRHNRLSFFVTRVFLDPLVKQIRSRTDWN